MKNILYLWKCFLNEKNIPNIIFINNLKRLLKERLNYNEKDDTFYGYTSPSIPSVSNFIKFWDEHIIEDVDEYFLEIEEINILFKQSSSSLYGKASNQSKLTENDLVHLIKHFYPETNIEIDKFIIGMKCNIWNKKQHINDFLLNYVLAKKQENMIENISIYDLYCEYSKKYCKKNKLIISKIYFELFINEFFKDDIDDNMLLLDTYYISITKKLNLKSANTEMYISTDE